MSKSDDAFQRLRRSNPVRETDVEGPDTPEARELLARILSTPRAELRFPMGRPGLAWRIPVILLVGIATMAAAVLWTSSIEVTTITCHDSISLDSEFLAAAPSGGPATAEACAPLWQAGVLSNPAIVLSGSVPPLVGCVDTDGRLHVFPTADRNVCSTLGLAQPDPRTQQRADALRSLEARLIAYASSSSCLSFSDAETFVLRSLEALGHTGWSIESQGPRPQRPCASFSIDTSSKTVHLVPIP